MPLTQDLKILHLSTYDVRGGAARAAYRLHEGLCAAGADSTMLVRRKDAHDPTVVSASRAAGLRGEIGNAWRYFRTRRQIQRYMESRPSGHELFSHYLGRINPDWRKWLRGVDVVNLHWVSSYFDWPSFFSAVPARTPVVWTLHDTFAFTGGCHYASGCRKFETACGACPQLGSADPGDLSARALDHKSAALAAMADDRLVVVTPSRWLGRESRSSRLLGRFAHHVIPYGLDTETFSPLEPAAARAQLGLDAQARYLLVLADDLGNRRKGLDLLFAALERLPAGSRPGVLMVGEGGDATAGVATTRLGRLDSTRELARAYSAADLYVTPAREDNLPNTVLESLACGTPVVAFDIGGMPDMIEPGRTGLLALPEDVDSLAEQIRLGLDRFGTSARAACRETALNRFAAPLQAGRYLALYSELLAKA